MPLTIEDLPDKLLQKIFSYVTSHYEQLHLSLISRKFCNAIRTISRDRYKMTLCDLNATRLMLLRSCDVLPFSKLDLEASNGIIPNFHQFWFKFGLTITELDLRVDLRTTDLGQLLRNMATYLRNLKRLKISLDRLSSTTSLNLEIGIRFLQLETLDLSEAKLESINLTEFINYMLYSCLNLKTLRISDDSVDCRTTNFTQSLHQWSARGIRIECFMQITPMQELQDTPRPNFRLEVLEIYQCTQKIHQFFYVPREIGLLKLNLSSSLPKLVYKAICFNQGSIDQILFTSGLPSDQEIFYLLAGSQTVKSIALNLFVNCSLWQDFPLEFQVKVHSLFISGPIIESESIRMLSWFPYAKRIQLKNISPVYPLHDPVQHFRFEQSTNIVNNLLQAIFRNEIHLKDLEFSRAYARIDKGGSVSNSGFRNVGTLVDLERLVVLDARAKITEAVFKEFKLPNLKELRLNIDEVTLSGFETLARNCPKLERLEFIYRTGFSNSKVLSNDANLKFHQYRLTKVIPRWFPFMRTFAIKPE